MAKHWLMWLGFVWIGATIGFLVAAAAITVEVVERPSKLRAANTAIMEELGRCSAASYNNTDLMMRFSHYTDGHSDVKLGCPECGDNDSDQIEYVESSDDIDSKADQNLLDDAREILTAVQVMRSGLLNQQTALRYILERLRETDKEKKNGRDQGIAQF